MQKTILSLNAILCGLALTGSAWASGISDEAYDYPTRSSHTIVQDEGDYSISPLHVSNKLDYFSGWFLGAGLGASYLTTDVDTTIQPTRDSTSLPSTTFSNDINDTEIAGDLFAGYGNVFNDNYYFGGELSVIYAPTNKSAEQTTQVNVGSDESITTQNEMKIKNDFSYTADLKFGYLVTHTTLIYLLAGAEYTKFDCTANNTWPNDSSFPNGGGSFTIPAQQNNYTFSKSEIAFMPGIGIETFMTDSLALRLQGTYAAYGSFTNSRHYDFNVTGSSPSPLPTISADINDKIKPARWLGTLDLVYHWN